MKLLGIQQMKMKKHGSLYIVFEPEEHRYFWFDPQEGKSGELESVNGLINRALYRDNRKESRWNQYAYIGTMTHKQIEQYLNGQRYIEDPTKFFMTWKRWYHNKLEGILRSHEYKTEEIVFSVPYSLAGQIDLIIEGNRKDMIVDWKTTWNAQKFVEQYKEAIREEPTLQLLKRNKLARYMTQLSMYGILYRELEGRDTRERIVAINSDSVIVFPVEEKYRKLADRIIEWSLTQQR